MHGGFGHVTTVTRGRTVSLRDLYAGLSQPERPVPASAPIVYCMASILAQEVMNVLWGAPRLEGRMQMVHMDHLMFMSEGLG
jgi:hypothetical protein